MTTTIETAQVARTGSIRGIPYYANGTAPAHLQSATALRERRLKLGPSQQAAAFVRTRYYKTLVALYDPADCVELPARRIGDEWAYRDRRTCPKCRQRRGYVIDGPMCGKCRTAEQAKAARRHKRTCRKCGKVGDRPYAKDKQYPGWHRCPPCRKERRAELAAEYAAGLERAQHCPDCGTRVMSKAAAIKRHKANRSYWGRIICPPCEASRVEQRERAAQEAREAEQRAIQARRDQVRELEQWARDALADPDVVILDTETTGLYDTARIVDIAVITATGETLLDTLVNPGEPIPAEASGIHGITDAMVAGAPTFAEVAAELFAAIRGKRVLVYNLGYDLARLEYEFSRLGAAAGSWTAVRTTWTKWEDAMVPYSDWYGEEDDWHGGYRWQRLGGGHRALGDCRAVIDVLKAMAKGNSDEDEVEW
jgi:DNA polymerase III epsilon subunit-like protein